MEHWFFGCLSPQAPQFRVLLFRSDLPRSLSTCFHILPFAVTVVICEVPLLLVYWIFLYWTGFNLLDTVMGYWIHKYLHHPPSHPRHHHHHHHNLLSPTLPTPTADATNDSSPQTIPQTDSSPHHSAQMHLIVIGSAMTVNWFGNE